MTQRVKLVKYSSQVKSKGLLYFHIMAILYVWRGRFPYAVYQVLVALDCPYYVLVFTPEEPRDCCKTIGILFYLSIVFFGKIAIVAFLKHTVTYCRRDIAYGSSTAAGEGNTTGNRKGP